MEPEYGSPQRSVPMESPGQVKYIRITDFGDDGISFPHEFVTAEVVESKYLLQQNDVLFARSGATAGKTFIYTKDLGTSIFAGYCIRFRFDPRKVAPWYVYFYTKTQRFASWVRSMQRPAGQPNINKEEFKSFRIPIVSPDLQASLVIDLLAARKARDAAFAQARALIDGIDDSVLAELGVTRPTNDRRLTFALPLRELKARCDEGATRLDPHYNAPRFSKLVRALRGTPSRSLGNLVRFSTDQCNPHDCTGDTFSYIEISGIDLQTGEVSAVKTQTTEAPSRARMLVREGDILVSLTRPHRGAIGVVPKHLHGAIASTGFAVVREIIASDCRRDFLLAILRSSVCLQQMLQRSSGGNYPAITEHELTLLTVPLPCYKVQKRIVAEIADKQAHVRRIRTEAVGMWAAAMKRFEGKLLARE